MINGKRSSYKTPNTGVPQGSLIGPILFALFLTPLSHAMSKKSLKHQVFADDTTLYVPVNEGTIHKDCIKADIHLIVEWFKKIWLVLKCQ